MPIRNPNDRWGWVSIGIHWLTVLLVLGLLMVGLVMQELPTSRTKMDVYALHKSVGLTVMALTLLRLAWRLFAGTPAPVAGTPRWQALVAQLTHGALYVVLLAMALSGWLYHSASGIPVKLMWFGLFEVPELSGRDEGVADFAVAAHGWLWVVLLALVLLHAGAALKHHYFDRDATLARMLPGLPAPGGASPGNKDPR